jgi:hypothetical protein
LRKRNEFQIIIYIVSFKIFHLSRFPPISQDECNIATCGLLFE